MFGDSLWSLLVIIGPIVLLLAIGWAMLRNRTTPAQDAETAAATKKMQHEQSIEDEENA